MPWKIWSIARTHFPKSFCVPLQSKLSWTANLSLCLFYFTFDSRVLKKSSLPRASSSTVCQAGLRLLISLYNNVDYNEEPNINCDYSNHCFPFSFTDVTLHYINRESSSFIPVSGSTLGEQNSLSLKDHFVICMRSLPPQILRGYSAIRAFHEICIRPTPLLGCQLVG